VDEVDGATRTLSRRTIASACVLIFLISLDVTIINVALPTIQRELVVPAGLLGWVSVAYTLPFATLMLPGGALSDRFGAARVFLGGVAVFGIGSMIDAAAPNFAFLLIGRVIQGIGAALCMPSGLAVLRSSVPPRRLGQATALWTFSSSLAISTGPIMSGALVQFWTWRGVFLINIPIVALAMYLIIPKSRTTEQRSVTLERPADLAGQALYAASFSLLIGGLFFLRNESGDFQFKVPAAFLTLSICGLVTFFWHERQTAAPVVPISLMTNKGFQSAAIVGGSISLVNFGLVYCLGLYYGSMQGSGPLTAGVLFLPMMVACGVSTSVVERIRRAIGDRMTVTFGLGAQLAGSILICLHPGSVGWVSANAAFFGFGVGLALPPVTAGLLAAVDSTISGVASGAFSSIRQFASSIGVAVLGLLARGSDKSVHVDLRSASAICAAVLVIALATYLATSVLMKTEAAQVDAAN
jgi:MFS transporter, DHA2 family, methylenomycin A resistance protein